MCTPSPTPCTHLRLVHTTGTDNSDRYQRYQTLFDTPDTNKLQKKYEEIVGPGFEEVDPTLAAMFNSIRNTVSTPDVDEARSLCDASLWDTMDLDKVCDDL